MCGACGRTVTADEVLGPVRTVRQHHLVASLVNALCAGLPGAPGVKVAGDAWLLRGATGAAVECRTVAELWAAVGAALSGSGRAVRAAGRPSSGLVDRLADRLTAERSSADGLRRDVIDAGLTQLSAGAEAGQAASS